MIQCIGWKRLEANRFFVFANVTKREFNAIMRRAFVFRIRARFEDERAIESTFACKSAYWKLSNNMFACQEGGQAAVYLKVLTEQ